MSSTPDHLYDPPPRLTLLFNMESNQAFHVLAKYIGVFGKPENYRGEAIAMTAPVISNSMGGGGTMTFVMPF